MAQRLGVSLEDIGAELREMERLELVQVAPVSESMARLSAFYATQTLTAPRGEDTLAALWKKTATAFPERPFVITADGDEYSYDIAVANTSNDVYVAGRYSGGFGISGGGTDLNKAGGNGVEGFLVKLAAADGDPIWAAYFLGNGDQRVLAVDATDAGDVVVTGHFDATMDVEVGGVVVGSVTSNGGKDVFLARFGSAGAWQWLTSLGSTSDDEGRGVKIEGDGSGLWLSGRVRGTVNGLDACTLTGIGGNDVIILELDPNGPI